MSLRARARVLAVAALLLLTVAAAALTSDRTEVDSQAGGANRLYAPGVSRLVIDVGEPTIVRELHYTVIIQVEARDAEPEACCLDRWTQLQVEFEGVLYRTREAGLSVRRMTNPWPDGGGVDPEHCKWTRVDTKGAGGFRIGGTDDIFDFGSAPLVVIEVDGPEWFYSISATEKGCRDAIDVPTELRSLREYMKAVFPEHLSQGGNYFAFETPLALVAPGCVTNFGGEKGNAQDVEISIKIFIWEGACTIPSPPFPFRVPPRYN